MRVEPVHLLERLLLDLVGHGRLLDLGRAARRPRPTAGSSSPSSFWIAFICSRRMYSRWVLSISDLTSLWILPLSSSTSICLARNWPTMRSRSATSIVSSSSCRSSVSCPGCRRPCRPAGPPLGDVARGDRHLRRDRCARARRTARSAPGPMPSGPRPRGSSPGSSATSSIARLEVRLGLQQVEQPDAALALDDGADGPVLQADHLGDLGQGADGVELVDRVRPPRSPSSAG